MKGRVISGAHALEVFEGADWAAGSLLEADSNRLACGSVDQTPIAASCSKILCWHQKDPTSKYCGADGQDNSGQSGDCALHCSAMSSRAINSKQRYSRSL